MNQDTLKEILDYNKNTGLFVWKKTDRNMIAGNIAGSKDSSGYIRIKINKKRYQAHRLAWIYEYGNCPRLLDHKNCIRHDNRICNIREATYSQNGCNRISQKNNTSGFKGVTFHNRDNRWQAQIYHQRKKIHIGYYTTPESAYEAYKAKAIELHGEFARF